MGELGHQPKTVNTRPEEFVKMHFQGQESNFDAGCSSKACMPVDGKWDRSSERMISGVALPGPSEDLCHGDSLVANYETESVCRGTVC